MNLDMTLREFFELADRVSGALSVLREARGETPKPLIVPAGYSGPPLSQDATGRVVYSPHLKEGESRVLEVDKFRRVILQSTPQPNRDPADVPEGLTVKGQTGIEIIAERQRAEIARRAEERGEVVLLDPKLGLVDAEAQAVKARLKAAREQATADALAKMTPAERAELES